MPHLKLKNKILELLAPAKDFESAKAAILCGADGVFIGGPAFGARADACNKLENIKAVCDFAHRFNVKVHITLNTLLFDNEIFQAQELIYSLAQANIDVLIVQELSIFTLDIPKGIELHASTQCCIDTVEKLKYFASLGVTQVVLPREFTLEKIRQFHEACPNVRLECFVLGALCVGYSGICHISDSLKGRSANRGSCAQICRLPMQLFKDDKEIAVGHLLSLKDNYTGAHLSELIDAGVSSFKIEGRLKDSSYVANSTAYMRQKLDLIISSDASLKRQSLGNSVINFNPDITKTFNRGFTDGLLVDCKDNMGYDVTPKFLGPKVAVVKNIVFRKNISIIEADVYKDVILTNGDGLTYIVKPNPLNADNTKISSRVSSIEGFRINKVSSISNRTVEIEVFGRILLKQNTVLYRNFDIAFEDALNKKDYAQRTLKYDLSLNIKPLKSNLFELVLSAKDETQSFKSLSINYEFNPELCAISEEKLRQTLSKKIDVFSCAENISIEGDLSKLTLPISALNDLRRRVLDECLNNKERINKDALFIPFKLEQDNFPKYPRNNIDERLVLNKTSKSFYEKSGSVVGLGDSTEDDLIKNSLMTCKFCLINKYGKCSKKGGSVKGYTLAVSGKIFKIKTDCKNCYMHILKI